MFYFRRNYKSNLKTRSPESPQNKITDERSSQSEREDNEDSQGENHIQNPVKQLRWSLEFFCESNSILDV